MTKEELFPLNSEQTQPKDIKRVLLTYTRYWYWFIIATAISIGVAFFYLRYYAVRQYSVYSTLLIKDDKSSTDALSNLGSFKTSRNIDNEIEVLKSKGLMKRVVGELNLSTSYYVEGQIKNKEIYGVDLPIKVLINKLDSSAVGKTFTVELKPNNAFVLDDHTGDVTSHNFGQEVHKPYGVFIIIAATIKGTPQEKVIIHFEGIEQVAERYNRGITVQIVNKNTSVLSLGLIDPIPAKAKDLLNKLMEVYNREAIKDKSLMATNTLMFLDDRLDYLTKDLSGVERTVEKYKSVNGLTDIATQAATYTSQETSYNKQLSEWAIQIDVLKSIENYLAKGSGSNNIVPSTLGIQDGTLVGLIQKFNELQMERERMLRTTQPGNPLIQNIDEQLVNLRVNILENLRNIKRGLQITSNNLKTSSGQFQSKIKQVPGMERELLQINRQQQIKQNIYSYLLQTREETALALAATASMARVIDPATGGDYPVSPNGQSLYLIALVLGLGLPFAGIYLVNMFDDKVKTQQDVSSMITNAILGEIAHNDTGETVVVGHSSRSPIAEMFRLIRTNLHFAAIGREKIVVLITSSISGEGKTFFSINLGASFAITDKRVVLIDLDFRKPRVAAQLALPDGLGVTDFLVSNDVTINDIIRQSEKAPDLFVISSGSVPPNPAELLLSSKFAHLVHELKKRFDYIVIDTPPVGQVADAFTISPFVDLTIYLVRYGYTNKDQLNILKNINKSGSLINPMIVLNDAKKANAGSYGYGYGYGYEYDKEDTKKRKEMI